jgi:O-Antigen ligase
MTSAAEVLASSATRRPGLAWGLSAFIWLLSVHALVITVLFGAMGWPAGAVRAIAAWKEALIALLFGLAVARTVRAPRPGAGICWLDLVVAGLGVVSLGYFVGASAWFGAGLPLAAQLYALRDAAFVSLLYFVGRASPEVAESPRLLRALFLVGVVTSAIAVLERFFVTPEILVVLGAARYVQAFLGATPVTLNNVYGLPDNYWTQIGTHFVQRAGSTYMSGQGFAVPFLVIMPAATIWALSATRRAASVWLGYALLWTGLLLTVTRLTIGACALGTVMIIAVARRWSVLVGLSVAGLTAFGAALVFVPGLATFVWETVTWQSPSSAAHLGYWTEGLEQFLRNPLGVGLGSTDFVAARFGVTGLTGDNQYLKYAVELGVLGFLLHVAVLAGAFSSGIGAWLSGPSAPARATGLLLVVATLGIALNATTAVVFNSPMLAYIFFWLAGSVTSVARHPEAAAP